MIKSLIISLFVLCSVTACSKEEHKKLIPSLNNTNAIDSTVPKVYTYLALGDSYTIGQSVPIVQIIRHKL